MSLYDEIINGNYKNGKTKVNYIKRNDDDDEYDYNNLYSEIKNGDYNLPEKEYQIPDMSDNELYNSIINGTYNPNKTKIHYIGENSQDELIKDVYQESSENQVVQNPEKENILDNTINNISNENIDNENKKSKELFNVIVNNNKPNSLKTEQEKQQDTINQNYRNQISEQTNTIKNPLAKLGKIIQNLFLGATSNLKQGVYYSTDTNALNSEQKAQQINNINKNPNISEIVKQEYINQETKNDFKRKNKNETIFFFKDDLEKRKNQKILVNKETEQKIDKELNDYKDSFGNLELNPARRNLSDSIQQDQIKIQNNINQISGNISKKIAELSPSIGNSLAGAGISFINPYLGTSYFIIGAMGSYEYQAKQIGMTDEQARDYGLIMGYMEGATEMVGIDKFLKMGKAASKGAIKEALKNLGLDIIDNAIQEAVIDPIDETAKYLTSRKTENDYSTIEGGKKILSHMFKDGFDGALTALITGGVGLGISSSINIYDKIKNGEIPSQNEIKETLKDIQNSKKINILDMFKKSFNYQEQKIMNNDGQTFTYLNQTKNGDIIGINQALGKKMNLENDNLTISPAVVLIDNHYNIIDSSSGLKLDTTLYNSIEEAEKSFNDKIKNIDKATENLINQKVTETQLSTLQHIEDINSNIYELEQVINNQMKQQDSKIVNNNIEYENSQDNRLYSPEEAKQILKNNNINYDLKNRYYLGQESDNIIKNNLSDINQNNQETNLNNNSTNVSSQNNQSVKNQNNASEFYNNDKHQYAVSNINEIETELNRKMYYNTEDLSNKWADIAEDTYELTNNDDNYVWLDENESGNLEAVLYNKENDEEISRVPIKATKNGNYTSTAINNAIKEVSTIADENRPMQGQIDIEGNQVQDVANNNQQVYNESNKGGVEDGERERQIRNEYNKEDLERSEKKKNTRRKEEDGKTNGVVQRKRQEGLSNYEKQKQEKLGKDFKAEIVDTSKVSKNEQIVAKGFNKATGLTDTFYRTNKSTTESAFYNANGVFQKDKPLSKKKALNHAPYHEFGHWLKDNMPEQWNKLYDIMDKTITDKQITDYIGILNNKEDYAKLTEEEKRESVINEVISDSFGNWANDIVNWIPYIEDGTVSQEYRRFLADITDENEYVSYEVFGTPEQEQQINDAITEIMTDVIENRTAENVINNKSDNNIPLFENRKDINNIKYSKQLYNDNGQLKTFEEQLKIEERLNTPLIVMEDSFDITGNNNPIFVPKRVISKAKNIHGITEKELYNLPDKLKNYVLVTKSQNENQKNSIIVFLDKFDSEERPIIVTMNLDKDQQIYKINEITSIYGRDNIEDFLTNRVNDKVLKINDKKIKNWLNSVRVQFPEELNRSLHNSITQNNKDVKFPEKVKDIKNLNQFINKAIEQETDKYWKGQLEEAKAANYIDWTRKESRLHWKRGIVQQYLNYKNGIEYSDRTDITEDSEGNTLTKEQQERYKDVSPELRDSEGRIKHYYHGTQRADRVGNIFEPSKATSGAMAFFTDNENIAKAYSNYKKDTSLSREYETEYDLFKANNMNLDTYWRLLNENKKNEIRQKGYEAGLDEDYNVAFGKDMSKNSFGDEYKYLLQRNNNNAIKALFDIYINSGNLFQEDMIQFKDVLEYVGAENVSYLDKYKIDSKVYDVYLNIKNPFNTSNISKDIINQFKEASKTAKQGEQYSADGWDKSNITPEEWIERLENDLKEGTTQAWTCFPDWVTDVLKKNGYDGIVDTGGKNGGIEHQVVVPFYSNQIKNSDNQNPTDNPDIRYSDRYDVDKDSNYGFYSQLEKVIEEKMPNTTNAQQLKGILDNAGIKQDEMKWIGLDDYLKAHSLEKLSKEKVMEYIKANQIHIETVQKGENNLETLTRPIKQDINIKKTLIKRYLDKYEIPYEEYEDGITPYRRNGLLAGTIGDTLPEGLEKLVDLEGLKKEGNKYEIEQIHSVGKGAFIYFTEQEFKENMQELSDLFEQLNEAQMNLSMIQDEYGNYADEIGVPKYKNYSLKGGENYQEKLYTLPGINKLDSGKYEIINNPVSNVSEYKSPHWNEKNVLAHTRTQDFTDINGNKVLFIDEIQSDLHQEGRKKGYVSEEDVKERIKKVERKNKLTDEFQKLDDKYQKGEEDYIKSTKEWEAYEKAEDTYIDLRDSLVNRFAEENSISHYAAFDFVDKIVSQFGFYENNEELISDIRRLLIMEGYKLSSFSDNEIINLNKLRNKYKKELNNFYNSKTKFNTEYRNSEEGSKILKRMDKIRKERDKITSSIEDLNGIADVFPFKKNWHEFALRRIINDAVSQGYDEVAWTTGRQQRERYNLSEQIDGLGFSKKEDATVTIRAYKDDNMILERLNIPNNELQEYIGKDLTTQILNSKENYGFIEDLDSSVNKNSNSGMYLFYDQEIPSYLNKYLKKWNSKVENITLKDADGKEESKQPGFKITDKMRNSVKQNGQPLFSDRADIDDESKTPKREYTKEEKEYLEKQRKERLEVAKMIKERSFLNNVLQSNVDKEFKKVLRNNKENFSYEPLSNEETMKEANKVYDSFKDFTAAKDSFLQKDLTSATDTAIGELLIRKALGNGNYQEANNLTATLAEKLTTAGQTVQAAAMFKRMTPEGMLMFAQKRINKINEELAKKYIVDKILKKKEVKQLELTDEKIEFINEMMKQMQEWENKKQDVKDWASAEIIKRQQDIILAKIMAKIGEGMPVSTLDKVAAWRNIAMLLNPKTIKRNLIGNIMFTGLEDIVDTLGVPIDKAVSLMTGEESLSLPNLKTQYKGLKKGLDYAIYDTKEGITTSLGGNKFEITPDRVFKNEFLNQLHKASYFGVEGLDRPFMQSNYDSALEQIMKKEGLEYGKDFPTNEMEQEALETAMYRTFKNKNKISDFLIGTKRVLNQGRSLGLGDVIGLTYPNIPGNLTSKTFDYSVIGFYKAIKKYQAIKAKKIGGESVKVAQRDFVRTVSRSMIGNGILAISIGAALAGIITASGDDDNDKLKELTGQENYAINVSALLRWIKGESTNIQDGDFYITYSNYEPLSSMIASAAEIGTSIKKDGKIDLGKAAESWINSIMELSTLNNFSQLFRYNLGGTLMNNIYQFPSSFLPNMTKQIAQLFEVHSKSNYSDSRFVKNLLNPILQKIPGLSSTLESNYDTFGNEKESFNKSRGLARFYNVFLNTSFTSTVDMDDTKQELYDLYLSTGSTDHLPLYVKNYFMYKGQKITLTAKEKAKYQETLGKRTAEEFKKIMATSEYKNMTDEEKVKKLKNIISDINTDVKGEVVLEPRGLAYDSSFTPTGSSLSKSGYKLNLTEEMQKEYEQIAANYYSKYQKQGLYNEEKLKEIKSKAKDYAKSQMFIIYKDQLVKNK